MPARFQEMCADHGMDVEVTLLAKGGMGLDYHAVEPQTLSLIHIYCGFCYTQLTDVEQEVNGLYTYERVPKFDPEIISAINRQKAACERD